MRYTKGESKEIGLALPRDREREEEAAQGAGLPKRQLSKFVRLAYMIDYMGLLSSTDFRSQSAHAEQKLLTESSVDSLL